jgi:hypothetical protein
MELSSSWKATSFAASQEFPIVLLSPKVEDHVDKNPPLARILTKINPVHTTLSYLYKIPHYPPTYVLVYIVVSFPQAFPKISHVQHICSAGCCCPAVAEICQGNLLYCVLFTLYLMKIRSGSGCLV